MADVSGSGATSSPQLSSSLSRKLNKVLELNTEEPELLAALNHLSGWYGPPHAPNSKHARRLLRSDLERQTLRINKDFLLAFSLVQLVCARTHVSRRNVERGTHQPFHLSLCAFVELGASGRGRWAHEGKLPLHGRAPE
jgi:hypothetical protein